MIVCPSFQFFLNLWPYLIVLAGLCSTENVFREDGHKSAMWQWVVDDMFMPCDTDTREVLRQSCQDGASWLESLRVKDMTFRSLPNEEFKTALLSRGQLFVREELFSSFLAALFFFPNNLLKDQAPQHPGSTWEDRSVTKASNFLVFIPQPSGQSNHSALHFFPPIIISFCSLRKLYNHNVEEKVDDPMTKSVCSLNFTFFLLLSLINVDLMSFLQRS